MSLEILLFLGNKVVNHSVDIIKAVIERILQSLNFALYEIYNFLYPGPLGKFENAGADMQGELLA